MSNINDAIAGAKSLIDRQIKINSYFKDYLQSFDGYQKVFLQTNENVLGYVSQIGIDYQDKKSALCVASSGDQAFSLITEGILNLELFDVNNLTEYYVLGLKRAMVLKYSYYDYLKVISKLSSNVINNEEIMAIMSDLIPYMDQEYRYFWYEVSNYYYALLKSGKVSLSLGRLLFRIAPTFIVNFKVSYLNNEESYNLLKERLSKANMHFQHADAYNLKEVYNKQKFDVIALSNILDYFYLKLNCDWKPFELELYVRCMKRLLNENGIMFLQYVFTGRPINFSAVSEEDLKRLKIESYDLEDAIINPNRNTSVQERMLLVRK